MRADCQGVAWLQRIESTENMGILFFSLVWRCEFSGEVEGEFLN